MVIANFIIVTTMMIGRHDSYSPHTTLRFLMFLENDYVSDQKKIKNINKVLKCYKMRVIIKIQCCVKYLIINIVLLVCNHY